MSNPYVREQLRTPVASIVADLATTGDRRGFVVGDPAHVSDLPRAVAPERAEAGSCESPWGKHPRIQHRTIWEQLGAKGIDYPHVMGANVTYRRAQRARTDQAEALPRFDPELTGE